MNHKVANQNLKITMDKIKLLDILILLQNKQILLIKQMQIILIIQ